MSTSLLIGWLCGAKKYDQAYKLNLQNLKVTILLNATVVDLLFLFGRPLLSLFTKDPDILKVGCALCFGIFSLRFSAVLTISKRTLCAVPVM